MPTVNPELLSAVLDELIPPQPELNLAGAGRSEVVQYVLDKLTETGMLAVVDAGLAQLGSSADAKFGLPFVQLTTEDRVALLQAVVQEQEFLLPILMMHTSFAYYSQVDVLEQLGYEPRPPFPQGYDIDVGDEQLFRDIRQRVGRPEEMS